jgi:hypothetical protein
MTRKQVHEVLQRKRKEGKEGGDGISAGVLTRVILLPI